MQILANFLGQSSFRALLNTREARERKLREFGEILNSNVLKSLINSLINSPSEEIKT